MEEKACTPILGPGLCERIIFSRREVATYWAKKHGYPMSPYDRDVYPRVAQYVITHQSYAFLTSSLREALRTNVLHRYPAAIPAELQAAAPWSPVQLSQGLTCAYESYALNHPSDPYLQLAQLRLPIYITCEPFNFIERALIQAGAQPVVQNLSVDQMDSETNMSSTKMNQPQSGRWCITCSATSTYQNRWCCLKTSILTT